METLFKLLNLESESIARLFQQASFEGEGTSQEVADRREAAVAKFLRKFFPFPYQIAKGNIVDSFGNRSKSIDCLLLNPAHPHTIGPGDKYSMIFAEGVDAAIEVKPAFNSTDEIERGLKQIQSVKKLQRTGSGIATNNCSIPTFIFSIKTFVNFELLVEKIVSFYEKECIPVSEQFDFIVIDGSYIILNEKMNGGISFGTGIRGIYYVEMGNKTLAAFLYWLNKVPTVHMRPGPPVLEHYVPWKEKMVNQFVELNERVRKIG